MKNPRIEDIRRNLCANGQINQLLAFELGLALSQPEAYTEPPRVTEDRVVFSEAHLRSVIRALAFNYCLQGRRIQIIKIVRDLSGLGLKEAKDLVDNVYLSIPAEFHQMPLT